MFIFLVQRGFFIRLLDFSWHRLIGWLLLLGVFKQELFKILNNFKQTLLPANLSVYRVRSSFQHVNFQNFFHHATEVGAFFLYIVKVDDDVAAVRVFARIQAVTFHPLAFLNRQLQFCCRSSPMNALLRRLLRILPLRTEVYNRHTFRISRALVFTERWDKV